MFRLRQGLSTCLGCYIPDIHFPQRSKCRKDLEDKSCKNEGECCYWIKNTKKKRGSKFLSNHLFQKSNLPTSGTNVRPLSILGLTAWSINQINSWLEGKLVRRQIDATAWSINHSINCCLQSLELFHRFSIFYLFLSLPLSILHLSQEISQIDPMKRHQVFCLLKYITHSPLWHLTASVKWEEKWIVLLRRDDLQGWSILCHLHGDNLSHLWYQCYFL